MHARPHLITSNLAGTVFGEGNSVPRRYILRRRLAGKPSSGAEVSCVVSMDQVDSTSNTVCANYLIGYYENNSVDRC